ncbi:MAG: deoxyribose-phosphate aldolase [Halobacteriaceae archaeon]
MDREALAARIDNTALGPTTTPADVERVVDEAVTYGTNVCVPPCYVPEARERAAAAVEADTAAEPAIAAAEDLTIVTVVGFPHGQHATAAKVSEAEIAAADGADELDVVANVGRLRAGDAETVGEELAAVVDATPCPVKVIVEAGLCSDDQLRTVAELAVDVGASHLKTSTGFAGGRARVRDVALLSEYLPVKASGGIADFGTAASMLAAGAERIGASRGVAILEDFAEHYTDE